MATDWFGVDMAPLPGGYSGETFVVGTGDDAVVLRIYRRQPERALIDASLLRLMRGLVWTYPRSSTYARRRPTPRRSSSPSACTESRSTACSGSRRVAWPGRRWAWSSAGSWGRCRASRFSSPDFFTDARLTVSSGGLPHDLAEWADLHRRTSRLASWPERDWQALKDLVDQAQALLDEDSDRGPARTVLVHGDFNPKNILVDPQDAALTALLDWEFAHAGSIHTDFGNFTRFERDQRLVDPMIEGFVDSAPGHIRDPFEHGRAVDLWAMIELAGRTPPNPVCELASRLLLEQARTGDLSAWPWKARRVDPVGAKPVS